MTIVIGIFIEDLIKQTRYMLKLLLLCFVNHCASIEDVNVMIFYSLWQIKTENYLAAWTPRNSCMITHKRHLTLTITSLKSGTSQNFLLSKGNFTEKYNALMKLGNICTNFLHDLQVADLPCEEKGVSIVRKRDAIMLVLRS